MTDGPTKPPNRPHVVTKASPAARALPLRRLEGKTKMIDCTTNSINAVSEKPTRPTKELDNEASNKPAAMVSRPKNSIVRQRFGEVARRGKIAILSETPEIYGAEHLLTRRAVSREVGEKLIARIRWWEDYCQRMNAELNNNPSAGNKDVGLTTILEKSLGAVAKAGSSNLVDVYQYAEGLVFMDTPRPLPWSSTRASLAGCRPLPRKPAFSAN